MKKLILLFALMLAASMAQAQGTFAPTYFLLPGATCPPVTPAFSGPGYMVDCFSNTQVALQTTYNGNTVTYGGLLLGLNAAGASTVINSTATLTGSSFTPTVNTAGTALLNTLGKKLIVEAYGTYSITTSTPTLAISLKIGAQTVCTATSTATTNAVTTFPWHFQALVTTAVTGTSGQDEAHCKLDVVLGASATAAASVFVDNNTALSTAYDHTLANAIVIQGLAAGASNAALLRDLTYEIKN